jgi:hypothetical protein
VLLLHHSGLYNAINILSMRSPYIIITRTVFILIRIFIIFNVKKKTKSRTEEINKNKESMYLSNIVIDIYRSIIYQYIRVLPTYL